MAVTAHVYTKLQASLANKQVDLDSDALKCALFSAYTSPSTNVQSAQYYADVTAAATEITSSGYTAGGVTLTGVTISSSGAVTTVGAGATIPSWTGLTAAPAFAVFYDSSPGSSSTNPVICYWDLGGAQSLTGANFQLTVNASGLITFTAS